LIITLKVYGGNKVVIVNYFYDKFLAEELTIFRLKITDLDFAEKFTIAC